MKDTLISWCDRIIRYGIYALFFFVPLVFTNTTSELFELNKMWITWEVTLFIAVAWVSKMILERRVAIKRTPLDIPLLLFLLSQIISTIFSLDPHTSFWGYYSRFNGGLLSTITYIFLYYAVISNLEKSHVFHILRLSLLSGLLVALWGLPSHYGKDPTCLLFRGSFDVECWTDAFKPTVRIFSTLGQPAWMSAYLNMLLPIGIAFAILHIPLSKKALALTELVKDNALTNLRNPKFLGYVMLVVLMFACLLFTNTRAGVIAFWVGNVLFWLTMLIKRFFSTRSFLTYAVFFNTLFLLLHFFFGTSFSQLDRFTFPSLIAHPTPTSAQQTITTKPAPSAGDLGGTDSGKIRQIVWQGAVDVWKAHPLIGSGVETFAFAYYQFRPASHNMTSEWDYLYNKAHNEYLNYLATTGILGLGTYLAFILLFLIIAVRFLLSRHPNATSLIVLALVSGFATILITNFFGFSVVIMNLYLFLIPAFIFLLEPSLRNDKGFLLPKHDHEATIHDVSVMQWTGITGISLIGLVLLLLLIRFWYADKAYALGSNLNRVQEYQQSYLKLGEAVSLRPSEPIFKDEFALNNAMIATLLMLQDPSATPSAEAMQQAQLLTSQAIALSNEDVQKHPNNITFWKNRVRLFYALAQVDKRYLTYAIDAVTHVFTLAPTDAKVAYNYGALLQETGDNSKSAQILEKAVQLKPDYRDAYYALAIAYNTQAVDSKGTVIHPEMREKAIQALKHILTSLSPDDTEAKKLLSSWQNH